ncbi:PQQ-binding-like beta-propeller repeat protein [Lignipirellula cremea]|uniref:Outer membrane biogenesis protein BamB n=1 Tax=Lignipirellula cremea TaxID=2528010 RepID=A0A518DPK6_9BACT|nr:PQQ-binding-like beta-propeller repeat protein [Lignipirellula cremea]QDU93771.1 outer membrane biogenesis protein BamB [Lignipirellula cremea]
MIRTFSAACCALLLMAGAAAAAESDAANWSQWRGPGRDAHSPDTGLMQSWETTKPRLLWTADGLGEGYASVAIANDVLYTTGNFENGQAMVAVSLQNGEVLWKTPFTAEAPKHGHQGSRSTPTVDGDRVYAVGSNGEVVCFKTADGTLLWDRNFSDWNGRMMSGWGFAESPLVDGDVVVCTPGGDEAMLVALNKMTGEEVWTSSAVDFPGAGRKSGAGYSSIVVSNGGGVKQYVQLVGAGVIGVRASDGKFLWGYGDMANGTANIPTPIVDGDYVFCSTGYKGGAALLKLQSDGDGVKAEEVYYLEAKLFENHHGGMVKVGDYIYAGHKHNQGFPICLEMMSGKVAWGGEERGEGEGSAAVIYADGNLLFRYQTGQISLIAANPEEQIRKGFFMPEIQKGRSWAHPVVINGKLYLREQDQLMCYDLTPPRG